jgi:hypothetical protein
LNNNQESPLPEPLLTPFEQAALKGELRGMLMPLIERLRANDLFAFAGEHKVSDTELRQVFHLYIALKAASVSSEPAKKLADNKALRFLGLDSEVTEVKLAFAQDLWGKLEGFDCKDLA